MSIAEKLTEIAENVPKVYEAGKKSQYDEFWNSFQQNGTRTNYTYGFAGVGAWSEEFLIPKYKNLQPLSAVGMFFGNRIENLAEHFQKHGITLDLSKATSVYEMFSSSSCKMLPVLDISAAGSALSMFAYNSNLETVEGLICGANNSFIATFASTTALKKIIFSGVIANDIDLKSCTLLSKESIESLINTLSSTTSGKAVTLSKTAKGNAFTDDEWASLIATKTNWTISLV